MKKRKKKSSFVFLAIFFTIIIIACLCSENNKQNEDQLENLPVIDNINERIEIVNDRIIVDFPSGINLNYAGQISKDTFFIIYNNKHYGSEYTFCWFGHRDSLIEYKVLQARRNRDGGTSTVMISDTNSGYNELFRRRTSYFYFPAGNKAKTQKDQFNGRALFKRHW